MMEHSASESAKKQSHMEMTTKAEVEVATTSYVHKDNEIDLNYLNQEQGIIQVVKSEPALLVKEEMPEDSSQGGNEQQATSTSTDTVSRNDACGTSSGELLDVKHELSDMNIGLTVLQHMDIHYAINKNESAVMEENTLVDDSNKAIPCNAGKKESVEDKLRDSSSNQVHGSDENKHLGYKCSKCSKVFSNEVYRNVHIKTVHGTEKHKCAQCHKEFSCKLYLSKHVRYAHSKEQHECDICKKMYKSRAALHVHLSIIHRRRFTDFSAKQVPGSEEINHQGYKCLKESHKCTQCNKEFKFRQYLLAHIRNIHSKGQYECEICKKMCKSRGALYSHVFTFHRRRSADSSSNQVHGSDENKHPGFKCSKCPKVFNNEVYRNVHIIIVHGTKTQKCAQCDKKFTCKQYLSKHVRDVHSKEQYECDICKKMCKSRGALHSHVSSRHRRRFPDSSAKQVPGSEEIKYQSYKCNKCLKVFNNKMYLNVHIKRVHGTESHKCTQCNKELKCKTYLLKHIRYTHSEGQYECDTCKKVCKSRGALRTHVLTFHRRRSADKQQGNRGAVTASTGSSTDVAACSADQCSGLIIKQESDDTDLDIGPTVLQHMDSCYTVSQEKMKHVKMDSPPLTYEQTEERT